MLIIFCGPLEQIKNFFYYPYIQAELGNLGGVILLALCTGIIFHPMNIHKKHCSFHPKITIIVALSLKIPTLFTIFLLFKPSLIIIRNSLSFFLVTKAGL